jgi:hypothetical protein
VRSRRPGADALKAPNSLTQRVWRGLAVGVLLVGAIACAGPAPIADAPTTTVSGSEPATTTATSETAPTTAPAVTSTTLAPDAAPPELEGLWKVDSGQGETLRVTFRGNSYSWAHGAGGHISVNGDTIQFSNAIDQVTCPGSGTYRWMIEGEILTSTLLDSPDDCTIRQGRFNGKEFYR